MSREQSRNRDNTLRTHQTDLFAGVAIAGGYEFACESAELRCVDQLRCPILLLGHAAQYFD
jgi:hypothetical protein